MKKVISFAVVASILLAACASGSGGLDSADSAQAASTPPLIPTTAGTAARV